MKRIGILTAGGDTPALNATIFGAVQRANQSRVEVFGIIKGFSGLLNPQVPHVHLNPSSRRFRNSTRRRAGPSSALRATTSTRRYRDDRASRRTAPPDPGQRPDLRRRRRHAQRMQP